MQLSFGSGAVWGERTDVTGSGIGPRQFGVLQDIQIDFDWTDKPLYGQLQFPVAIARGQGKITGKAKFAQILGLLYSDIFFGLTPATGQFAVAQLEAASIPAVTPYTVTVASAANYNDDLGVVYGVSGKRFNRVTTPSAAVTNQVMGTTPTFKATFYTNYAGSGMALRLNACMADKLSLPTKVDDWTIHELDFSAFADASGTIGYLSTVE